MALQTTRQRLGYNLIKTWAYGLVSSVFVYLLSTIVLFFSAPLLSTGLIFGIPAVITFATYGAITLIATAGLLITYRSDAAANKNLATYQQKGKDYYEQNLQNAQSRQFAPADTHSESFESFAFSAVEMSSKPLEEQLVDIYSEVLGYDVMEHSNKLEQDKTALTEFTKLDKDPFKIVGVERYNISDENVKKAYLQKARTCHPDKHPDNPAAKAAFQELNAANKLIATKEARDQTLKLLSNPDYTFFTEDSFQQELQQKLQQHPRCNELARKIDILYQQIQLRASKAAQKSL